MTMYKPRNHSSSATTAAAPVATTTSNTSSAGPCNCGPAAPTGPGQGNTPTMGVALTPSLEEVIYFNGRFLKAEDFQTEQQNYLLRIALSERAQGAGVSYGFHVTATTAPLSTTFVDQITQNFMTKVLASERSRQAWTEIVTKDRKPAEVAAAISAAVSEICKAEPGHSDASLVIGRGHAANGWGSDLYLKCTTTVKLASLLDAFSKYPTTCTVPGPSITPIADQQGVGLTGAYLLCACVNGVDFGKVPVYGVQCGDNAQQVCSLGYHSEGVALQLVYFPGVTPPAAASNSFAWRGEGARKYFDAEIAAHASKLPLLGKGLPFSAEADAPDCGSHVPIGVVYLSGGDFVAFDEWTAKRLRTPAEMAFWLGALLQPSKPAQLARVVQFQAQLTEALTAAGAAKTGGTLWDLGFATDDHSPILELPGVGFLPINLVSGTTAKSSTQISPNELTDGVNGFFDGVSYRLMPATSGQMNAVFGDALESGPLKLTRKGPLGIGDPRDKLAQIEELLLKAAAGMKGGPSGRKLPEEEVPGMGTDLVGFIIESARGRIGPTTINSFAEFEKAFGEGKEASAVLAYSVSGFFDNGGRQAVVTSVGIVNDDAEAVARYAEAADLLSKQHVSLLAAPGKTSPEIQDVLLKACEASKRCFALLDSPERVEDFTQLIMPRSSEWGVFLYPWLQVQAQDPAGNSLFVPPSGFVAGAYVRSIEEAGKPPANELLRGAVGVRYAMTAKELAAASAKRINVIQSKSGFVQLSGAYTIQPNPEAIPKGSLEQLIEDNYLGTLGQIAGLVDGTKQSLDEPQVFVWYPEQRAAYQGYVMFTWPIAQLGGCITTPEAHLTIGIEMTVMRAAAQSFRRADGVLAGALVDGASVPAAEPSVNVAAAAAVPTSAYAYGMVPAHSVLNEKLVVFRDNEWAGPAEPLPNSKASNDENAVRERRPIILTSLRISIDPQVCDLGIKYDGRDLRGKLLEARGEVDGKWLRAAKGFSSLRIGLTGSAKDKYDVRYRARYRVDAIALETSWVENYEEVSLLSVPWVQLGMPQSQAQRLAPFLPIEAIYVKVIPKGTASPSLSRLAVRWTGATHQSVEKKEA